MRQSAHFTVEERLTCEGIIRRYEYHAGSDACHRACCEAIGRTVSKKTLDNWRKDMQTAKPRKKVKPIEENAIQSGLQNSETGGENREPPVPKIDPSTLTNKSLLELSTTLLRGSLEQLLLSTESMSDGTRVKVASEAADIARKLLPQPVIDALPTIERYLAELERGVKMGLWDEGVTLTYTLEYLIKTFEQSLDKPKATDFVAYQNKMRDLWDLAELDYDKQFTVAAEIIAAYEPPEALTIDDLLALDRQVYEACVLPVVEEPELEILPALEAPKPPAVQQFIGDPEPEADSDDLPEPEIIEQAQQVIEEVQKRRADKPRSRAQEEADYWRDFNRRHGKIDPFDY